MSDGDYRIKIQSLMMNHPLARAKLFLRKAYYAKKAGLGRLWPVMKLCRKNLGSTAH